MKIYKVLPDLSRERHMKIWHKALRSQWSATDIKWDTPQRITNHRLKDQMGRILTPVLMGEQAALYSVSGLIPILGKLGEVESQFYLTTWAVDEARHTELFANFYGRLDREPMPIRRFPAGYLFQSQIVSDDPAEWLSGVLVSEVIAKKLMEEFRRLDLDPLLSDIAHGVLRDEARHLGFNHIYLEDRFCELHQNTEDQGRAYAEQLHARVDSVLGYLQPMLDALATELDEIGIDRIELFDKVGDEARQRLDRSIRAGHRLAEGKQEASPLAEAALIGA
ncbi:MAG: ferritin-like domain-containing protein [bacterium]|nr:ferritin-like domain-containing protein [bacterium]